MITYVVGDLFTSPAKVLVNTVNTVGVMGKGIAREFKRIYPEMFEEYQYYCEHGMLDIGKLWLYKSPHKWILNFPTKKHWRNKSKIEYIEAGLAKFADTYDAKGLTSISFPMLGCGNGELDWTHEVQPLMESHLGQLPIDVYIHVNQKNRGFVPEHKITEEMKQWLRAEPKALPFGEFWDDLVSLTKHALNLVTAVDRQPFAVKLDEETMCLNIHCRSKEIPLTNHAFRDFWQLVRSSGYCIADELPAGLNQYSEYVLPLLSRLDYIRVANISRKPVVGIEDSGIHLLPNTYVFDAPAIELRESRSA